MQHSHRSAAAQSRSNGVITDPTHAPAPHSSKRRETRLVNRTIAWALTEFVKKSQASLSLAPAGVPFQSLATSSRPGALPKAHSHFERSERSANRLFGPALEASLLAYKRAGRRGFCVFLELLVEYCIQGMTTPTTASEASTGLKDSTNDADVGALNGKANEAVDRDIRKGPKNTVSASAAGK